VVLVTAVLCIVLAVKTSRGRGGARVGLVLVFALLALVSGVLLASSLAQEGAADTTGAVVFGLNTAACAAVVVLALAAPAEG
jgi:hypothetical protein